MEFPHDHEYLIAQSQKLVQETQKLVSLGIVSIKEMRAVIRTTREVVRTSRERLKGNLVMLSDGAANKKAPAEVIRQGKLPKAPHLVQNSILRSK